MKKLIISSFSVIFGIIFILFCLFNFVFYPKKYKNYVVEYAEEYSLDIALVYAVIKTESNFDKNAKSYAGAMGLMQLIPSTAKWIAESLGEEYIESNLYEPETNIKYGCFYLNYLYTKFEDMGAVICSYNAGETAVKNWLDDNGRIAPNKITYKETQNYYKRVMSYYQIYKNKEICE